MPQPIAICIEDLSPVGDAPRFLRCTALPGRQPGLRIDSTGAVLWKTDTGIPCEICVSEDAKLMLFRPMGASPVTLRRAGRSLDVPACKPVVMIDQDQVDVGMRRLRIHIHGPAQMTLAPAPFSPQPGTAGLLLRTAAAAAATITALSAAGCSNDIEVRSTPPVIMIEPEQPPQKEDANPRQNEKPKQDVIDVRPMPTMPPEMRYPPRPPSAPPQNPPEEKK